MRNKNFLALTLVLSLCSFAPCTFALDEADATDSSAKTESVEIQSEAAPAEAESQAKSAAESQSESKITSKSTTTKSATAQPKPSAKSPAKSTSKNVAKKETPKKLAVSASEPSKAQVNHAANEQAVTDKKMIEAVNQVDGVEVDPNAFEPEKKGFTIGDLNPIKWIFKPVIDMQKRIIHLEKQMMRLEAPIASLQKPMVGLREDMVGVQTEMQTMHGDIVNIHGGMRTVNGKLGHIESQLDKMYGPVKQLKDPVIELKNPVVGVGSQLTTLKSDLKELKDVVKLTSTLILVAVIGVGLLIVVGTPIAAILVWRHRHTIVEKLGGDKTGSLTAEGDKAKAAKEPASSRR